MDVYGLSGSQMPCPFPAGRAADKHCAAHGQYIFRKLNAKLLDDILPTHLHPLPHLRVLLADLLLQSLIGQHHVLSAQLPP